MHHGNGTVETFRANPDVLVVSVHQWGIYPGSGPLDDAGTGKGAGYTVNLPVPPMTGDAAYESLLAHVVWPLLRAFEPRLLLLSAGFDAHVEDPLGGCCVSDGGFGRMGALGSVPQ